MAETDDGTGNANRETERFIAETIASDHKKNVSLLAAWRENLLQEARGLALQARIAEAVDGKAGERTKRLKGDIERVRLSLAEIDSMMETFAKEGGG